MRRFPVTAGKDPRAMVPLRPPAENWAGDLRRLRDHEGERLVELARTLCPHEWLSADSYRSTVLAIDRLADGADIGILREGLPRLDDLFHLSFSVLSEGNRILAVKALEGTAFVATALRLVTRHLYDLPEVWAGCGYDGVGGYDGTARNDFDDETLSAGSSS